MAGIRTPTAITLLLGILTTGCVGPTEPPQRDLDSYRGCWDESLEGCTSSYDRLVSVGLSNAWTCRTLDNKELATISLWENPGDARFAIRFDEVNRSQAASAYIGIDPTRSIERAAGWSPDPEGAFVPLPHLDDGDWVDVRVYVPIARSDHAELENPNGSVLQATDEVAPGRVLVTFAAEGDDYLFVRGPGMSAKIEGSDFAMELFVPSQPFRTQVWSDKPDQWEGCDA